MLVPKSRRSPPQRASSTVRVNDWTPLGYDSAFPYLAAAPDSIIQIAMPLFSTGVADVGLHRSPIPSRNGLKP